MTALGIIIAQTVAIIYILILYYNDKKKKLNLETL